jgi:hypothetical protein
MWVPKSSRVAKPSSRPTNHRHNFKKKLDQKRAWPHSSSPGAQCPPTCKPRTPM